MQRDLFSAYRARFVEDDALQAAKASAWPGAEPLLRLGNRRSKTNLRVRVGRPRKKARRSIRQRMMYLSRDPWESLKRGKRE